MSDSVPSASYSIVCNVLRQWRIWLIRTYRVYRLYDICFLNFTMILFCLQILPKYLPREWVCRAGSTVWLMVHMEWDSTGTDICQEPLTSHGHPIHDQVNEVTGAQFMIFALNIKGAIARSPCMHQK